jgi:hypothetical protein
MIYRVGDHFVISSGGMWLPGAYENSRAARLAFKLPNETLQSLQDQVNRHNDYDKRIISYDSVMAAYRRRKEGKA